MSLNRKESASYTFMSEKSTIVDVDTKTDTTIDVESEKLLDTSVTRSISEGMHCDTQYQSETLEQMPHDAIMMTQGEELVSDATQSRERFHNVDTELHLIKCELNIIQTMQKAMLSNTITSVRLHQQTEKRRNTSFKRLLLFGVGSCIVNLVILGFSIHSAFFDNRG